MERKQPQTGRPRSRSIDGMMDKGRRLYRARNKLGREQRERGLNNNKIPTKARLHCGLVNMLLVNLLFYAALYLQNMPHWSMHILNNCKAAINIDLLSIITFYMWPVLHARL